MDVKKIIKERGFTLEKLAASMDPPITKGTLSRNISNNPTLGTLQKIADIIGCTVGDFFRDEVNGGDFMALVKDGADYYHANSLPELKEVVKKIEDK